MSTEITKNGSLHKGLSWIFCRIRRHKAWRMIRRPIEQSPNISSANLNTSMFHTLKSSSTDTWSFVIYHFNWECQTDIMIFLDVFTYLYTFQHLVCLGSWIFPFVAYLCTDFLKSGQFPNFPTAVAGGKKPQGNCVSVISPTQPTRYCMSSYDTIISVSGFWCVLISHGIIWGSHPLPIPAIKGYL